MENNAYIKINGKDYGIPERLSFGQIIALEKRGFKIDYVEESPFEALSIIFSVIANISIEESVELLDSYFTNGGDYKELIKKCFEPYTNFFNATTKKKSK